MLWIDAPQNNKNEGRSEGWKDEPQLELVDQNRAVGFLVMR